MYGEAYTYNELEIIYPDGHKEYIQVNIPDEDDYSTIPEVKIQDSTGEFSEQGVPDYGEELITLFCNMDLGEVEEFDNLTILCVDNYTI